MASFFGWAARAGTQVPAERVRGAREARNFRLLALTEGAKSVRRARVAELAYAPGLGSGAERHGGSTPPSCTVPGSLAIPVSVHDSPATAPDGGPNAGPAAPAGTADEPPPAPRLQLLEQLAEGMRAAARAGDLGAVRVAHEAIGRLLGDGALAPAGVVPITAARRGRRS